MWAQPVFHRVECNIGKISATGMWVVAVMTGDEKHPCLALEPAQARDLARILGILADQADAENLKQQ